MATLVFFHAHPDDEAISTGGTMALNAAGGHRVVLVVATAGEEGEVDEGVLGSGENLGQRRSAETEVAAAVLGVSRVVFLGYRDSGMMGEPANGDPSCFWQADVDDAAARLGAVLADEDADVLTVYDDHGGYGHPDHIQVHRVGHRAARVAGTPRVYEATINRDVVRELRASARAAGEDVGPADEDDRLEEIGLPDAEITTAIDVSAHLEAKRAAMLAHASQITEDSWFLAMPDDVWERVWGTEWFRRTTPQFTGAIPAEREAKLI